MADVVAEGGTNFCLALTCSDISLDARCYYLPVLTPAYTRFITDRYVTPPPPLYDQYHFVLCLCPTRYEKPILFDFVCDSSASGSRVAVRQCSRSPGSTFHLKYLLLR